MVFKKLFKKEREPDELITKRSELPECIDDLIADYERKYIDARIDGNFVFGYVSKFYNDDGTIIYKLPGEIAVHNIHGDFTGSTLTDILAKTKDDILIETKTKIDKRDFSKATYENILTDSIPLYRFLRENKDILKEKDVDFDKIKWARFVDQTKEYDTGTKIFQKEERYLEMKLSLKKPAVITKGMGYGERIEEYKEKFNSVKLIVDVDKDDNLIYIREIGYLK